MILSIHSMLRIIYCCDMFYFGSNERNGLNTFYNTGAESSGGDETASKKKRRSKPRGGRGHGGKSKPESKHAAEKFVSFFSRTVRLV